MRNTFLDVDDALETLQERRCNLVKSVKEHDSKRFKSESVALKSMNHFVETCDIQKLQADEVRELARQQVEKARELATRRYKI